MKRVIRFSKSRTIMFILSATLIVGGVAAVFLRDGFNLGIDFTGGLNKQIQIAPQALALSYGGVGQAEVDIRGGVFTLELSREIGLRRFVLRDYATLSDLAAALAEVPDLGVEITGDENARTERVLSLPFAVDLSEGDLVINMRVASEEEVFAPIGTVREILDPLGTFSIQMIGRAVDQEFSLKVPSAGGDDAEFLQEIETQIVALLEEEFGEGTVILKKTEFIGSLFSADLVRSAIWSLVVALVLILVYVTVRFKFVFAISAVLALIHDVAVMIGVIAVAQLELSSATIAAFLTIIGYSLNDTIVVFDRIRENTALMPESDRETVINTSITQSLSRTTITSLTTLLAVTAIYVFGTGAIKIFALNLIVGVVVGTYSSIFIASPVVLGWMNLLDKRKRRARRPEQVLKLVKPQKGKEEKAAGDKAEQERAAQEEKIVSQIQAAAAQSRKSGGPRGRTQPGRKKRRKKKR